MTLYSLHDGHLSRDPTRTGAAYTIFAYHRAHIIPLGQSLLCLAGTLLQGKGRQPARQVDRYRIADAVQSIDITPRHAGVPAISRLFSLVGNSSDHTAFRSRAEDESL